MRRMEGRVWKLVFMATLICGGLARSSAAIIVCESTPRNTSTLRGFGVDCSAALTDLENETRAEALATCDSLGFPGGICGGTVTVTKSCSWNENHLAFKVAGYRTFRCVEEVPEPGGSAALGTEHGKDLECPATDLKASIFLP